jgi:hypothetical protein
MSTPDEIKEILPEFISDLVQSIKSPKELDANGEEFLNLITQDNIVPNPALDELLDNFNALVNTISTLPKNDCIYIFKKKNGSDSSMYLNRIVGPYIIPSISSETIDEIKFTNDNLSTATIQLFENEEVISWMNDMDGNNPVPNSYLDELITQFTNYINIISEITKDDMYLVRKISKNNPLSITDQTILNIAMSSIAGVEIDLRVITLTSMMSNSAQSTFS